MTTTNKSSDERKSFTVKRKKETQAYLNSADYEKDRKDWELSNYSLKELKDELSRRERPAMKEQDQVDQEFEKELYNCKHSLAYENEYDINGKPIGVWCYDSENPSNRQRIS